MDKNVDSLLESLQVKNLQIEIISPAVGARAIPVTTAFVSAKAHEFKNSPRAVSVGRKLENAFLYRLKQMGLFSEGDWIDIGGSREYGEWLQVPPARYDIFNLAT